MRIGEERWLIQSILAFDDDFGMFHGKSRTKLDPVKLSLLGALGTPFKAVLVIVAMFIGERFGRWPVFLIMQCGSITGATVMYTSKTFTQIVVGRVILSGFSGWHDWLIPMYLAEIVPGPVRGSVIATYMASNYLGSFSAACTTFITSKTLVGSRQYKIPFALMLIPPLLCLCLSWFLPESPRWLVRNNKMEKAIKVLHRLNGSKPGYSPEEEATLLKDSIDADEKTKGRWRDLIQGTNLVRYFAPFSTYYRSY